MRLIVMAFLCAFLFVQPDFCSRPNSNQPQGGWRYHPLDWLRKIPQVIGYPVDGSSSDEDSDEERPSRGGPFACATLQRDGVWSRRKVWLRPGVSGADRRVVVLEGQRPEPVADVRIVDGSGLAAEDGIVVAGKRSENRVTGFGPRVTRDKRIVVLEK